MRKKVDNKSRPIRQPPAKTQEARENQLINQAYNLAEQQLLDGTATSQVISHFLKLGSMRSRIENELLEKQKALTDAKIDNLQSTKKNEELLEKAIAAFKSYSGDTDDED